MGRQILTNKWTMSSADTPAHKAGNRVRRWCWCAVLKKRVTLIRHLPKFSISDSEGAVSRGMVSVPFPVIDMLQEMCWSSAYMLYLHDRL